MHTETEILRTLFTAASQIRPATSDSTQKLLSLSRIYLSVSELVQTGYPAWDGVSAGLCSELGNGLFKVMLQKAGKKGPVAERLLLVSSMYDLMNGTELYPDSTKRGQWDRIAAKAIDDYFQDRSGDHGTDDADTAVCLCLLDWFYFSEDAEDDPWMKHLKTTIGSWNRSFTAEGWKDTDIETALDRIEIMNRNSYMLLDPTYDSTIREAFRHYVRMATAKPSLTLSCSALGRLYDIATGGDTLPEEQEAGRFATAGLFHIEPASVPGSDTHLYCTSYRIADLCRTIINRLQAEALAAIA